VTLRKVAVANRGEIALRIVRACRDAGLLSVACYAESDRDAPYVRQADEAFALGGDTPAATYLDVGKLLGVCARSGADALHPGYGLLSESAGLAQAVIDAGLTWIGPSPAAIEALGDKVKARRLAARVGAPLVAGTAGPLAGPDEAIAFATEHGLPIAIKASFGGGGRGLRVAHTLAEIPECYAAAVRESTAAFGRGECFAERYVDRARHVEAQILADSHGQVIVVGTRDCSLQRRHQKLVEEAPAPWLTVAQETTIRDSAAAICREAGYQGAGTVEYLVGQDGSVSFLEVNTRLQVEHPVTEETTGVDLVREQFRIAAGERLDPGTAPATRGHTIEFRINGEDPGRGFMPGPGTITRLVLPAGPGVRVDAGVEEGSVVAAQWDSLLAKVIVSGRTRAEAIERSRRALDEMVVEGLATVLPFHRAVVRDPAFVGDGHGFAIHTRWIEDDFDNRLAPYGEPGGPARAAATVVEIGGRRLDVAVPGLASLPSELAEMLAARTRTRRDESGDPRGDDVRSPMQGTVTQVPRRVGDVVERGDVVVVVEAMKMENAVVAHKAGTIRRLAAVVGQSVGRDEVLAEIVAE
jgi:acetyl-CoA/propionyl-CoA carboxylase biotin carboxyl carrier protein